MKLLLLLLLFALPVSMVWGSGLEPGDPAPEWTLPGSDGREHSLSDHLGKRVVVVAWFPKAFTGG